MKNDSIDNIRLDINREKVKAAIYARQGDTRTRTLHLTLADNGNVIELGNAILAEICMKKPDGTLVDNGCVIAGNELQYTFRTNDIAVVGENICQVVVTFDDGSMISSPEFSIYIYQKTIDPRVVLSTNEYGAWEQSVVETKQFRDEAELHANNALESETSARIIAEEIDDEYNECVEARDRAIEAEANAKGSEDTALRMISEGETILGYCRTYSEEAELSAGNAKSSEAFAFGYMNQAESASDVAKTCKDDSVSASSSARYDATRAEGYATSAKNSSDNADEMYHNCKAIYDNIGGGTLTIGETSTTAHRGDHGKIAYDHSQTTGNPHNTTYTDVGADASGSAQSAYQNATAYTDRKIADLISGAPSTLDTLKELADAFISQKSVVDALNDAIGTKANESEFTSHATNSVIHVTSAERSKWDNVEHNSTAISKLISDLDDLTTRISALEDKLGYPYTP